MNSFLARIPLVIRVFQERDLARQERDLAATERDALVQERDRLRQELQAALEGKSTEQLSKTDTCVDAPTATPPRTCVFCDSTVHRWLPFRIRESTRSPFLKQLGSVGSNVERFECPNCSSIDRERHLRLFMDRLRIMEAVRGGAVLHMSPEYRLRGYVESFNLKTYVRGDLEPRHTGVEKIDLQQIPYPAASFDMVICNHMLEHVADAGLALREIFRVLKPGARTICQTPYAARLSKTFADPFLQSPVDRLFLYGQEDHVRLFGRDIESYFTEAGFLGRLVPHEEILPDIDPEQYGINEREPFFDFVRP